MPSTVADPQGSDGPLAEVSNTEEAVAERDAAARVSGLEDAKENLRAELQRVQAERDRLAAIERAKAKKDAQVAEQARYELQEAKYREKEERAKHEKVAIAKRNALERAQQKRQMEGAKQLEDKSMGMTALQLRRELARTAQELRQQHALEDQQFRAEEEEAKRQEEEMMESLDRRAYLETESAISRLLGWSPDGDAAGVHAKRTQQGGRRKSHAAETAEREGREAEQVLRDEDTAWRTIEERAMRELDRQERELEEEVAGQIAAADAAAEVRARRAAAVAAKQPSGGPYCSVPRKAASAARLPQIYDASKANPFAGGKRGKLPSSAPPSKPRLKGNPMPLKGNPMRERVVPNEPMCFK